MIYSKDSLRKGLIMDLLEVIAGIQQKAGKNTAKEGQKGIDVSEVWHMWDVLVAKYDAIESIHILSNFAQDKDLNFALNSILKHFEKGARKLEKMLLENAVPLPERPPQEANSAINLEVFTDKYIFTRSFGQLQGFVPILATAFIFSSTPRLKKLFKDHLISHLGMIDNLLLFGELKGYFSPLPIYQP